VRLFIIAFQFLTIIPLPFQVRCEERDLGRSMALFPIVGVVLGAMLIVADSLLSRILPRPVTDLLLVALLSLVTGALHLDGVADVCDGLAARGSKERFLSIMKDSRIGAVGAVGLLFAVLLKYQALQNIPQDLKVPVLLLFPAVARYSQVLMATGASSARGTGLGTIFISGAGAIQLLAALGTILTVAFLSLAWKGIVMVAAASLLTFSVRWYFQKRLGGITGDVIGFSSELTEIGSLLLILSCCDRI
jgi:adenosylcobinamide-GDP ribazoletransferase